MSVTEKLLKLFRVDEQLHALKSRLEGAERYYEAQSRKVDEIAAKIEQLKKEIRNATATGGNFENEAKAVEERMEKLRSQMAEAKTNKEYTAFLTELNTIKLDKDAAETQALEHMGEVERLQADVESLKGELEERQKVCTIAKKEFDERNAAVADRVAELETERKAALGGIPNHALSEYEVQLDWHDGEAMAPVLEQDRRRMEYACGACHMSIPVERLSNLLGRGDITACPSCQRLLFVDSELREAFDKRLAKS